MIEKIENLILFIVKKEFLIFSLVMIGLGLVFMPLHVISTAITAIITVGIVVALGYLNRKLGTSRLDKVFQRALDNPSEFRKADARGIKTADWDLTIIEKHFSNSLDTPFSQAELDGIGVFSPELKKLFDECPSFSKQKALERVRAIVDYKLS